MTNKKFIIFLFGIGLGYFAAWKILESRYEQISQEEIQSVKETLLNKDKTINNLQSEMSSSNKNKDDINNYISMSEKLGYTNDIDDKVTTEKEKPFVICPGEFGTLDNYERISLTYYNDGVLADENNNIIENIDDIVGLESLDCFGEYEEDSVFVRNSVLKCDYEILKDYSDYIDSV